MKTLEVASLAVVLVLAAGCGRTGTICETAVDCSPGQVCTVDGCVFLDSGVRGGGAGGGSGGGGGGGLGGGMGGGLGGGMGGGATGGGLGGGIGGGTGGGGSTCRPGETQCPSGCKNLSVDLDNCGACARPCPEAANGRATCSAGICGITCSAGFADCDGSPLNGCEANFNDPSTCGSCRNVCPAGPNSVATCSMGACGLSCRPGFGNCDFFAPNGCETDLSLPTNCGTCGNLCRTGLNQTASCTMGQCSARCLPNFADCDGLSATGCEANLTSPTSCGSCMNVCPAGGPNTVATCTGTTCGVQCRPGFGDCDGLPATGCEADLNSDATCGSCTNACMMGVSCVGGICGGQMCAAPAVGVLTLNTTVTGTLPAGASSGRFPVPTCSTQSTRSEDLWTFTLTAANTVTFETGGTVDTVLYVRANCTANTDLACNDDTPGLGTLSRVTLMLQPGTYSVFVKQWGTSNMAGGPYSLTATVGAPVTNASCQTPTVLTNGVPVLAQDTRFGTTISTACLPGQGVQLFYRLGVPPNQRATITVTPQSAASMTVRLINTCTATSCLNSAQGTTPQVLTFDNRNGFTQNIIIAVGATVLGMNGTFDLRADLGPVPSSLNTTCATATSLAVNGPSVTGEFIDLGGPALSSCLPGQTGRVLYYSVVVPGRQAVQVTASPIGFDVGLRLFNACSQVGSCAAFADNAVGPGAEFLRITNPASTPQMYIVVASSSAVGTGGQFGITASTANPFAANNAFCDTPTVLPSGVAIAGELELPGGLPLHNVCLPSSSGYTRYYAVSVPQSATLQAMATPTAVSGIDVGVRVLSGCPATSCLASSDVSQLPSSSGAESAVVSNLSGAPRTYLVAVSGVNTVPSTSAAYNVIANVMPTAPNAFCAGATTMTAGQTVMDSLGAGGAATTACLPTANGLSKYYRVTVAPGERLAITASPSNFNLALRLLDSCAATSCAASSDASTSLTGVEQVTVQNDTTAPKDSVIVVSGGGAATPSSAYTLSVQRALYRASDITASCDDLSLAPELLGPATMPAISDDAASLVVPLPAGFAFQLFRTPVTHYSACVNGFAQLHSSAAGVSNTSFGNVAMPNSAQPNWLLAPFWDDLATTPGTRVRSMQQGTAPNRVFTLEWFDAALNVGATAGVERLRFQTKLFETTNVVEFHYCSLAANGGSSALVSGGSATIGIESALGTEAVQRSFNTAGSVSTGTGVRFTPQ